MPLTPCNPMKMCSPIRIIHVFNGTARVGLHPNEPMMAQINPNMPLHLVSIEEHQIARLKVQRINRLTKMFQGVCRNTA